MKLQTRKEISKQSGLSISNIRHRIDKLQIVSKIKNSNEFLYNEKQVEEITSFIRTVVEVIKQTETFYIYQSKMNHETK